MTLPDLDMQHAALLRAEGVQVDDPPMQSDPNLPDKNTLTGLLFAIQAELQSSETDRREHMEGVKAGWDIYNLRAYEPEEMLLSDSQPITLPTTRARVDYAHGSLYGALAVTPFFQADVGDGQDGTVGIHAQAAIGEELDRCEFENALDVVLRGSLVGTIGFFKPTVVDGEDGPRLDVDAIDIRDLYLSPHNVRDLQQCTMIAHAYTETLGWCRDQAVNGVFSMDAVRQVNAHHSGDRLDGGGSERPLQGLSDSDSTLSDESRKVQIHEVYIKYRPRVKPDQPIAQNARTWEASRMWRVFLNKDSNTILAAQEWDDGFPFLPLRHQRGQTTIYAPSFPNIMRDIQWANDMLMSASIEADRMGVAPIWEVEVNSLAMEWLKKRREDAGGAAVRPVPGDVIPRRGAGEQMKAIYQQPTPPQIDARMNRLEQLANLATIAILPAQTYRSATEHRYAMAGVTAKEAQMLKVLRADLARLGEYIKRLYWKYLAQPTLSNPETGAEMKNVFHGTLAYEVSAVSWGMIRLTPRGMTTASDQMMVMQATQEALMLCAQFLPQKPMFEQAGLWPNVWYALSRRLDALGIQDWESYIGPNPQADPNETELDPAAQERKLQASMMLMQANNPTGGGGMAQMLPGADGGMRASDGAPTVPPGGAPMPGGFDA